MPKSMLKHLLNTGIYELLLPNLRKYFAQQMRIFFIESGYGMDQIKLFISWRRHQ